MILMKNYTMKNLARVLCCFKPIFGDKNRDEKNGESFALYYSFKRVLMGLPTP